MDALFLISLIVGGFFVLLSIFGVGDTDADADFELDADADFDGDLGGAGLVDLLSVRALFLFAAFFGLTGVLLGLTDTSETFRLLISILTGLVAGLGGNYIIKSIGYRHISSDVSVEDLKGKTARVVIPFQASDRGRISLVARGNRIMLSARSLDDETLESFEPGDEVVVVGMQGNVAEVVKPKGEIS